MATPSVRNVGTPAAGTGSTLAVTLPTCTAGDLLLIFAAKAAAGAADSPWSTPSGWALAADSGSPGANKPRLQVFTKTAIGSDSGSTVTLTPNAVSTTTNATTIRAVAIAYQNALGVHAASVFHGFSGTTTQAAPTVATTRACLIVDAWAEVAASSGTETITAPTTSRVAVGSAAGTIASPLLAVADQTQTSSGTSAAVSATSSVGSDQWAAVTVALYSNAAPNAPTLNGPIGSATIDRTITQRFSWTFSDPDPGDTQSAFDLRYSSDSGATWTTVSGTTPNNYVDIASGTLAAGSYQWQVRTYDALGVVGPYSASAFFTAASPPSAPTITYPTSGGTVQQSDHVTWSAPSQTDYQVRRVADVSGSPDTTTIYSDTGDVASTTTRTQALTFPTNSRYEHIQVRVAVSGLWSTWTDVRVQVSYTPPPTPTLTVTPSTTAATITVTIANPAPTGSQPALDHNDLYRSKTGGTASIRVATGLTSGATWVDRTPASGTTYSYQAVAVAGNATTAASAWTS